MTASIDITPEQKKTLLAFLRRFIPDTEVWAYGSRVKWTARTNSDLDLVAFTTPAQRERFSELIEALAESNLPFLVDFHVWDEVPERFHEIIRNEYVVLQKADKPKEELGKGEDETSAILGDYVTLQRGTTYKGNLVGKPGPALLGLGSIQPGGGFRDGDYKTYGGECPAKLMLFPGDLFASLKGATKDGKMIGSVARVPSTVTSGRLTQDTVKLEFHDSDQEIANFIYWVLRTPQYREYCAGRATGSAVVALSRDDFLSYPVPTITPTRMRVVEILGALDDKIELNRRMNATLEAMARALFQSWFVDFDPVRAKLDGRPPALDPATAALFPETFQDSPIGLIPHGWKLTTLGEACEKGGGNIQTGPFGTQLHASDYVSEGIPSIMPSDLRDNRIDPSSIARILEQDAARLSVYRVQTGDVVYSRRGDVERRSLIRHAEKDWLCGTGCLRVRFGPRGLNPHFGAAYLGTSESRAWVVRHAVGATMPNLNTSILGALPIVIPSAELQSRFSELVGTWDERGTIALEQSRTLATLRDTLLPKLLSGELSVAAVANQ